MIPKVGPSGSKRACENREQFNAFVASSHDVRLTAHEQSTAPNELGPIDAFFSLFDDDLELGDELSSRPCIAGGAVVGTDRRCTFCHLSAERVAGWRPWQLVDQLQYGDGKDHRPFFELFALLAHGRSPITKHANGPPLSK